MKAHTLFFFITSVFFCGPVTSFVNADDTIATEKKDIQTV